MNQLAIELPFRPALARADFLVSECNSAAVRWIEGWPDWPGRNLLLYGAAQCGKSHLARSWVAQTGGALIAGAALQGLHPPELAAFPAVAVDDAEGAPERALLHLYNCCHETGSSLLLVAREPPARWPLVLPDLASRLRAMPAVAIAPPDDRLLAGVLVKHFADRQVRVAPAVIAYAVRRIERSFAAAAAFAAALDRAALGARRPIGIALARRVLAEAAAQPALSSEAGVT
jgi:chromosomal replication initiation ATPase DnaA